MLGRSQAVRHRFLVPACAGSNPAAPAGAHSQARGARRFALLFVIFATLAVFGAERAEAQGGLYPSHPIIERDWPQTDVSISSVELSSIRSGGPSRDGIPAIDDPQFKPVSELDLDPNEPAIRLEVNGVVRGYPLRVLIWHEIVNDTIGGVPAAITYCPLCNTSIAFDRRLDGNPARFGTTGLLRNSDLVMYDDISETWWQQYSGTAIVGARTGELLDILPSRVTSIADLREEDSDMDILVPSLESLRPYGSNPYVGYDSLSRPYSSLFDGDLPEGIKALTYIAVVDDRAWTLEALRGETPLRDGNLELRWSPGLHSALDSRRIDKGRDIGRVEVLRDGKDAAHKITFAFVFYAFAENGTIYQGSDKPLVSWERNPQAAESEGEEP